jgi:hypothetical protein
MAKSLVTIVPRASSAETPVAADANVRWQIRRVTRRSFATGSLAGAAGLRTESDRALGGLYGAVRNCCC